MKFLLHDNDIPVIFHQSLQCPSNSFPMFSIRETSSVCHPFEAARVSVRLVLDIFAGGCMVSFPLTIVLQFAPKREKL